MYIFFDLEFNHFIVTNLLKGKNHGEILDGIL